MQGEIKRNPSLSPLDAYHLAKGKSPLGEKVEKERVEKAVEQEIAAKQKAQVGKSSARKDVPKVDAGIIFEKGKDGKFKNSLEELEEMLTGS